jgi:hypothetical protein
MERTVCIRLQLTAEQDAILSASCACFNAVAVLGWERREKNVALHQASYGDLRKAHPDLPPRLVISSRMKATEALRSASALQKKGKKVSVPIGSEAWCVTTPGAFASKKRGGRRACHRSSLRRTVRPRDGSTAPMALPPQTDCGVHLVGGCMWSWMSSHLNSVRPVALSIVRI